MASATDKKFITDLSDELANILHFFMDSIYIEAGLKNERSCRIEHINTSRINGPVSIILKQSKTYRLLEKKDFITLNVIDYSEIYSHSSLHGMIRNIFRSFEYQCIERVIENEESGILITPYKYRSLNITVQLIRVLSNILVEIIMAGNADIKEPIKYRPAHIPANAEFVLSYSRISPILMYKLLDLLMLHM